MYKRLKLKRVSNSAATIGQFIWSFFRNLFYLTKGKGFKSNDFEHFSEIICANLCEIIWLRNAKTYFINYSALPY